MNNTDGEIPGRYLSFDTLFSRFVMWRLLES